MTQKNHKHIREWEALRNEINKSERGRDYEDMIALYRKAIELDTRAKSLKIMTFLFYKDIGYAYFKMEDYKDALENFRMAKEQLMVYRRTQKLKNQDDWLNELALIEKYIAKVGEKYFE